MKVRTSRLEKLRYIPSLLPPWVEPPGLGPMPPSLQSEVDEFALLPQKFNKHLCTPDILTFYARSVLAKFARFPETKTLRNFSTVQALRYAQISTFFETRKQKEKRKMQTPGQRAHGS